MSDPDPTRGSPWSRYDESKANRPYANIAADQQPAAEATLRGGDWALAIVLAAIPAVLIGIYVANTTTQVVALSLRGATEVGHTAAGAGQGIAWGVASFLSLVVILRAFFALLNIERSLRR